MVLGQGRMRIHAFIIYCIPRSNVVVLFSLFFSSLSRCTFRRKWVGNSLGIVLRKYDNHIDRTLLLERVTMMEVYIVNCDK